MQDALDIALLTAAAFERAGVAYFLGGSLASSFQGEPRATNDIDFVVELATHRVEPLIRELGTDFDVDADALGKLLWCLAGGQVSSKQWRDIVEVLRVSGASMDRLYLDAWARRLGLSDWLARAVAEAGNV